MMILQRKGDYKLLLGPQMFSYWQGPSFPNGTDDEPYDLVIAACCLLLAHCSLLLAACSLLPSNIPCVTPC